MIFFRLIAILWVQNRMKVKNLLSQNVKQAIEIFGKIKTICFRRGRGGREGGVEEKKYLYLYTIYISTFINIPFSQARRIDFIVEIIAKTTNLTYVT